MMHMKMCLITRRLRDPNCLFPLAVKFFIIETNLESHIIAGIQQKVKLGHDFQEIPEVDESTKIFNVIGKISQLVCFKPHVLLVGKGNEFQHVIINPCLCHNHDQCLRSV